MTSTEQSHQDGPDLEPFGRAGESEFDRSIAMERRPDGTYAGHLDGIWSIGAGINGGLLLAACGNALRLTFAEQEHPDPISVSAYYLSAAMQGPRRSSPT